MSVEPYFLRSRGKFGFLADFDSIPRKNIGEPDDPFNSAYLLTGTASQIGTATPTVISQLSNFVKKFHPLIFPLKLPGGQKVNVDSRLAEIESEELDIKHYVVGSGSEAKSQFMGVKQSGPLENIPDDTRLCFLYTDRKTAHSLTTCSGRCAATRSTRSRGWKVCSACRYRNDRVSGIPVSDFN